MSEVTKADEKLIKRNVELELRFEQDTKLIQGCQERLTAYEEEAKVCEYNDLQLQAAQIEIFKLRKQLGR